MDKLLNILAHPIVLIGLGGAIGANLRYGLTEFAKRLYPVAFPWGTLAANVLGSLLLGLVAGWFAGPLTPTRHSWRLLLGVGLCGGFTTFSTFSLETLTLIRLGRPGIAFLYVLVSVSAGFGAVWLGSRLGAGEH